MIAGQRRGRFQRTGCFAALAAADGAPTGEATQPKKKKAPAKKAEGEPEAEAAAAEPAAEAAEPAEAAAE